MARLAGKSVIVTGGGRGVGRAAALAFGREGGRVVVADLDADAGARVVREIEAAGGAGLFVATDVTEPAQVERLVSAAGERFGRLDGALNAAADRGGAPKPLADFDDAEIERCLAVSLKGVWLSMKHQVRQMLAQDPPGGRIVNVSSVNGLGGAPRRAPYAAAKAGVLALTKSGALDYADRGIRINALVPGMLETDSREEAMDSLGLDDEARRRLEAYQLSLVPEGRLGRVEEVAEMAVWLLAEAPDYLTGAALTLDGGLTAPWR